MKLAFGHRAFAEITGNNLLAAGEFSGQSQTDSDRQASADDGVAAIEMSGGVK